MSLQKRYDLARLDAHKAEHNVEEARVELHYAEVRLREVRRALREIEREAWGAGQTLEIVPLPSIPFGVRV